MFRYLTKQIQRSERLDTVVTPIVDLVNRVLPEGRVRDVLHGKQLGHPLHPLLVALPIGMNVGTVVLDGLALTGGRSEDKRTSARALTGVALLATVPTALSGLADWASLGSRTREKRIGLIHAWANSAATTLYLASWFARRAEHHRAGAALSAAGGAWLILGGYLGGHLAYVTGVGVNRNADAGTGPTEWTEVAAETDLDAGPLRVEIDGEAIVVVRDGNGVQALGATCSHLGGPLDEGELDDGCLVCPWHGSRFDVVTGAVVRGPATVPQPQFDARIVAGRVHVRARE